MNDPRPTAGEITPRERKPLLVRASGSTYVVFGVLCALPLGLGVAPRFIGGSFFLEPLAIGGLLSFVSLVWLRSFRIELTRDEFRYRSLFGGARSLRYEEIERATIEVGLVNRGDAFRPHYRMVVAPRNGKRPIVVNLKVFPLAPLREVCAALDATTEETESTSRV